VCLHRAALLSRLECELYTASVRPAHVGENVDRATKCEEEPRLWANGRVQPRKREGGEGNTYIRDRKLKAEPKVSEATAPHKKLSYAVCSIGLLSVPVP